MNSKTSAVTRNYRLQEWENQIQECKGLSEGMTVKGWCSN